MIEPVVKCMVCQKEFNGEDAYKHTLITGHNNWELLLPTEAGEIDRL